MKKTAADSKPIQDQALFPVVVTFESGAVVELFCRVEPSIPQNPSGTKEDNIPIPCV